MLKDCYVISARLDVIRNGVILKRLKVRGNPKIRMVQSAEVKTSLSGTIEYDGEMNSLTDRIRAFQIIDGVEYPVGEYLISSVETTTDQGGKYQAIEGFDLGLQVKQASTENRVYYQKGTKYLDIVKQILVSLGIDRVIEEPCDLALATDREEWEIGTSWLTIINTLLGEINYSSLWFDFSGYARLGKVRVASAASITQSYREGEYSILRDGIATSLDSYSAYNVFTVVVSNADKEVMVATAVNDSPVSSISTVNRGRRISAPVEYLDEIASQEALQEYVENRKNQSMLSTETVTFGTAPIPTHQVGEVVALEANAAAGIYQETEWAITLGPDGDYSHTGKRVVLFVS